MKRLLFLSRLAFICNVLFLTCLLLQRSHNLAVSEDVKSTVIILGWGIAPFVNLAVNVWYAILLINKRFLGLPRWLALTNFLFLLVEIFVHFILPA